MKPTIYLALTHDWELRGDGSGDIEEIQFGPLRRLLEIYKNFGVRTTFLPEVMQQLTFRTLEHDHSELRIPADRWDELVRETHRQGHDLQLHLHSQWSDANYENGRWRLRGSWSILEHNRESADSMLTASKEYLERVLRGVDPGYRCIAFRASALAAAPSAFLFSSLAALGIQIDVSIAPGVFVDNEVLRLDYRECEETFLPYYPELEDARKVSHQREPIVCLPLNHFYASRRAVTKQNILLVKSRLKRDPTRSPAESFSPLGTRTSGLARVYEKLIAPSIHGKHFVSDTGRLDYGLMKEMLRSIRDRARQTSLPNVPVVLTNHPKDIRDWSGLERFIGEASVAEDLKFITLTELAQKLRSGEFQVRMKSAPSAESYR